MANSGSGSLSVINTRTRKVTGKLAAGHSPVVGAGRAHSAGTLTVIDPKSNKVVATVTVGTSPYGVTVG